MELSNPDFGTSEQKAHVPKGTGSWQECPRTTGRTSENVGSPSVRTGRQRALISEGKRLPAGSTCQQTAHVAKVTCAKQAGMTSQQRAQLTEG